MEYPKDWYLLNRIWKLSRWWRVCCYKKYNTKYSKDKIVLRQAFKWVLSVYLKIGFRDFDHGNTHTNIRIYFFGVISSERRTDRKNLKKCRKLCWVIFFFFFLIWGYISFWKSFFFFFFLRGTLKSEKDSQLFRTEIRSFNKLLSVVWCRIEKLPRKSYKIFHDKKKGKITFQGR